jgi:hypothetical protein
MTLKLAKGAAIYFSILFCTIDIHFLMYVLVKLLTNQTALPQRIKTRTPAGHWHPKA